jgi:hypothetical protein
MPFGRLIAKLPQPVVETAGKLRMWTEGRRTDIEIRQLRELQDAYARPGGPEVLLFGDSSMFWTRASDSSSESLAELIGTEIGRDLRIHKIVGGGYNPRLVMAFLDGLERCAGRPRVVLTPASLMMAATSWIESPAYAYEVEAAGLRDLIASGATKAKHLPRPTEADWDRYDRMPAASLYGARRTNGEARLIINSVRTVPVPGERTTYQPTTKWQHLVRVRHLLDIANAEALTSESIGVRLIADMAAKVEGMGLPSVGCLAPVNHEVIVQLFKEPAADHLRRNAAVVTEAYEKAGDLGRVVDASFLCPASDFSDPAHLNLQGRVHYAKALGAATREALGRA